MATEPKVDAYIARQADFARPILTHLRGVVHAASPQIEEAVKWGMPFFTFKGQNLCNMAGFKAHVAFGFWHDKVARDGASEGAMGQFGRIASLNDLPDDATLTALVAQAMALIDAGEKPRSGPKQAREPLPLHPAFAAAIQADPAATAVWAAFPPGKVRDYCEWINDAKSDATRDKRIAQAVAWIAEGKGRNWKYEKRS
ncbi:YdeI/OmpD-associated family protein [Sphingobium estronivorans]|uniref:YdeI/OmpD-associated family protein n=1 Tax=Sphingobium estronivorans TaxID=1577690 RepID=UPI00123B3B30|nr:YdeI/OmpD-associated family protein [Sphingobium estronivorans]